MRRGGARIDRTRRGKGEGTRLETCRSSCVASRTPCRRGGSSGWPRRARGGWGSSDRGRRAGDRGACRREDPDERASAAAWRCPRWRPVRPGREGGGTGGAVSEPRERGKLRRSRIVSKVGGEGNAERSTPAAARPSATRRESRVAGRAGRVDRRSSLPSRVGVASRVGPHRLGRGGARDGGDRPPASLAEGARQRGQANGDAGGGGGEHHVDRARGSSSASSGARAGVSASSERASRARV